MGFATNSLRMDAVMRLLDEFCRWKLIDWNLFCYHCADFLSPNKRTINERIRFSCWRRNRFIEVLVIWVNRDLNAKVTLFVISIYIHNYRRKSNLFFSSPSKSNFRLDCLAHKIRISHFFGINDVHFVCCLLHSNHIDLSIEDIVESETRAHDCGRKASIFFFLLRFAFVWPNSKCARVFILLCVLVSKSLDFSVSVGAAKPLARKVKIMCVVRRSCCHFSIVFCVCMRRAVRCDLNKLMKGSLINADTYIPDAHTRTQIARQNENIFSAMVWNSAMVCMYVCAPLDWIRGISSCPNCKVMKSADEIAIYLSLGHFRIEFIHSKIWQTEAAEKKSGINHHSANYSMHENTHARQPPGILIPLTLCSSVTHTHTFSAIWKDLRENFTFAFSVRKKSRREKLNFSFGIRDEANALARN